MKRFALFLVLIIAAVGVVVYSARKRSASMARTVADQRAEGDSSKRTFENYAREVQKIADRLGKTNAQVYVARAADVAPQQLRTQNVSAIVRNLEFDKAEEFQPLIAECENSFAEIKKAIASQVNVSPENFSPSLPVPNSLNLQKLGKLLLVKGMALEHEGRLDEALEAYLTEAEFGSLIGGKHAPLIAGLVGNALESSGYKLLLNFVRTPETPRMRKRS